MQEEKVSILNEYNEKLIGIKTIPSNGKAKHPTVILVHGFADNKSEWGMFDDLAKLLPSAGFAVYRFDFSGCGESEGDYSETSLTKLKLDLSKILEFVKLQSDVDNRRIGILTQSFGASVTIALMPEVKTIIMSGSVANSKKVIANLFSDNYNPAGISTRIKSNGKITKIKPQFWQDLENYNLLELIKSIHCPILFFHGSKDNIVPISETEAYFQNANDPKKMIVIENGNHDLSPNREKMYVAATNWFLKYLI